MLMQSRRQWLERALALTAGALAPWADAQPVAGATNTSAFSPLATGAPQAFDYAWLKGLARTRALAPYGPPDVTLPAPITALDYDAFQAIRFVPGESLWAGGASLFQLRFFHRGYQYREQVRMHEVVDGQAREIGYSASMFDLTHARVDGTRLPHDLGFAGFRVHFHTDWDADIAAFLGASYFRAVGADRQYGLSARGLAIDTGATAGEEFPRFSEFWFERPETGVARLVIHALLESPSVAGAYRIALTPGGTTTMDVDVALYPRRSIAGLGIAPLTTMFLCGENDRRIGNDWRPEIHDSDGLAMNTGSGEWIWRPLVNPPATRLNTFVDRNPRGFGLLQRDRNFDHYLDDSVYYDRRPSAWVEPKTGFGEGAVQLLEFQADDETTDNVVALWKPAQPGAAHAEALYAYRLHWGKRVPYETVRARAVATRTGIGGVVGRKRTYFSWRFAVDFAGGELEALAPGSVVEAVVTASRGAVEIASARPQRALEGYRAMFDIRPTDDSEEPIDLRLYLRLDDTALTETWLYQWTPPPAAERRRLLAQ